MASVEVSNVHKSFGRFEVIHGVSISVEDGEFVILVGPSGCGKSTLLRMVAGLESITSGELRIDGRVVNNVPPKERDIAMVFQNYALYPQMTVAKNMSFSLELAHRPKAEIAEKVGEGRRHPRPHAAARALSAPVVGRPAAAGRHGKGDRARPGGISVRRASVQSRREVARADARRNQGACSNGWRRRQSMSRMTRSRR